MTKRSLAAPFASLPIDASSSIPLYRQVYQRLRTAILIGQLPPGSRLPSTREMASELGVSRNTLMNALDQLIAEGYVEGHVGSGTFVSSTLPEDLLEARLKTTQALRPQSERHSLSLRGRVLAKTSVTVAGPLGKARPFIPGVPALDEFPFALWSRLIARRWRESSRDLLNYGAARGYMPLRQAIAAYLGPSRGVQCEADQIVVVSGTQQALDIAARILLDAGDAVLVEEYCYSAARAAFLGNGASLVPRVAITLRQVTHDLIVSAILFDDVDDMFERRILRAGLSRLIPIVRPCNSPGETRELAWLHLRGHHRERAVQLAERVIDTIVRQLLLWSWELRIRSRAFALPVQNEKRIRRHQKRRRIPFDRDAAEESASSVSNPS